MSAVLRISRYRVIFVLYFRRLNIIIASFKTETIIIIIIREKNNRL